MAQALSEAKAGLENRCMRLRMSPSGGEKIEDIRFTEVRTVNCVSVDVTDECISMRR